MFDANKVVWTTEEFSAASAADKVYEAVKAYVDAQPSFSIKDVPGLLMELGKKYAEIFVVVKFVFVAGSGIKGGIDRIKDLLTMLERDNGWLDE